MPPRDARLPFMNVNVFPIGRSDSLILITERGGGLEIIEEAFLEFVGCVSRRYASPISPITRRIES